MPHYPGHLMLGVTALAVTFGIFSISTNRLVRRKLRLSFVLLAGYVAVNLFVLLRPAPTAGAEAHLRDFEALALAAALINLVVITVINPLRENRVPDRFPAILQDALVIGGVLVAAMFLSEQLVTTSAVSAVVLGFALQDTLGNAFAGLALQSEKPFHVGQWIRVGDLEGQVTEVTWRATKLRTRANAFIILPNNFVAKEPVTNFSEPVIPTRLTVEVGASYLAPPSTVKAAMLEAIRQVPRALASPAPDALLLSFDGSAINYQARFWVADYEFDDEARDEVRTAIYYAFARHNIEIPWPIEVGYSREWPEPDEDTKRREREAALARIDLFAGLRTEQRAAIAAATSMRTFGSGEALVRQGEAGESMFVLCSGKVAVVVEPDRREVAEIGAGGYFGEMSLLTGEPRSATVVARGDVTVIELGADLFRDLGAADPAAVERIGVAAATRRAELDQVRAAAGAGVALETNSLVARMKRFLRLRI
jgi:small-conductance mechanosensitive channel/CRP-like cAMP-binding protein